MKPQTKPLPLPLRKPLNNANEMKMQTKALPLPEPPKQPTTEATQHVEESGLSSKVASFDEGIQKLKAPWMEGALSLQIVGLQALWQAVWSTLTSNEIKFSERRGGQ